MKKRLSARPRIEPGKASDYISHRDIQPGDKVVLCCRVSTANQEDHLPDQEASLRQEMEKLGAVVVAACTHKGPGWDPGWLARAAAIARGHGAKLVAETTNRFIRHPGYHSKRNPSARARAVDLDDLRWCTDGVPLVTMLHPDASPANERAYQSRRGQQAKGRKGGRPKSNRPGYKKQRRMDNLIKAFWMSTCGMSVRQIAGLLEVPIMTVHGWLRHRE